MEKLAEKLVLIGIGLFGVLYLTKGEKIEDNLMNISCNIPKNAIEGDSPIINVTLTTPSSNNKEISRILVFKASSYPTQEVSINMPPGNTLTKEFTLSNIKTNTDININLKE